MCPKTNKPDQFFRIRKFKKYRFRLIKMDGNAVCENLLSTIRNSGLNFQLSETPFGATNAIKKTFILKKSSVLNYQASSQTHGTSLCNPQGMSNPIFMKDTKTPRPASTAPTATAPALI